MKSFLSNIEPEKEVEKIIEFAQKNSFKHKTPYSL